MDYYYLLCNARLSPVFFFFFFNDTATTEIYTLSLHDALPISGFACERILLRLVGEGKNIGGKEYRGSRLRIARRLRDRKSTRLNSSHLVISYAVFCLKKKKSQNTAVYRRRCYIWRRSSSVTA